MSDNYYFNGYISEQVLRRYLSRSISYPIYDAGKKAEDEVATVLALGAKYIARAVMVWYAGGFELGRAEDYKLKIAIAHEADPDIVFEACLFETTSKAVEEIPIPEYVFRAFGLEPEERCFSYEAMLYPDGRYVDRWGKDGSVPDMTRLETQLFMYWHATFYIDAGFEGLHWGQVYLMSETDTDLSAWTKVLNMVREYARTHARRGMVLNNSHTHGQIGSDGRLLFDFHAWPVRMVTPKDAYPHAPTKQDPQRVEIGIGIRDSIYRKSLGGETHSGWSCDSLPYVVELDNYGGMYSLENANRPGIDDWPWGYDEVSWFANQDASFRRDFIDYAYKHIRELDENGYFEMTGVRGATYYFPDTDTKADYWYYLTDMGDGATVKAVWDKYAAELD